MKRVSLLLAALLAPASAQADWHEASSKHFVVYSDEDPEKLKRYTERLERFDSALRAITGTSDKPLSPNLRVQVYLVDNVAEIQKLCSGCGAAGFYSARATGPVAFVPKSNGELLDSQTILQHEYAHSFMFSTWPSVVFPKWFVEGFAEFVGTAFYRNGTLIIGKAPEHRAFGIDRTAAMPAERMLRLDPKDEDLDSQTLYGRGWLLTHYSLLGGHADQLARYIAAVNNGTAIEEASRAFGDLGKLDGQLNNYAKRGSLPTIALSADKVAAGNIVLRKLSAGEAATMEARTFSQAGVNPKRAAMVVNWARKAAAAYPNDAGAQNALAEAEFDVENYAAAEQAADRALAADPNSMHALLYKGMAQMEIAKAGKVTDAARWKDIRSWFIKANRQDPDYAQPLVLYYQSFRAAGQQPSKPAMDGLISAYVHAPYDDALRIMAGKVLLEQGNLPAARIAFEKIAYGPHGGKNNPALQVITALDKQGKDAALALIAEQTKKAEAEAKEKKQGKGQAQHPGASAWG